MPFECRRWCLSSLFDVAGLSLTPSQVDSPETKSAPSIYKASKAAGDRSINKGFRKLEASRMDPLDEKLGGTLLITV